MNRLYKDEQWIKFREEIIEMDGFKCVKCGRNNDEVTLQVHHKKYEKKKAPWEYPPEACETLCKGCHARIHGIIRPNEGWDLYSEEDLGDLLGECECCGTPLRYVFHIDHPFWEPMAVGTNCCDNLTGTAEATEYRKRLDRLKRFTKSKRWKNSPFGLYLKQAHYLEIEIRPDENKSQRIYINKVKGKKVFKSIEEAKSFVFIMIENGDAKTFALNHPISDY